MPDFNFKPSFPIAGVADLIAQRPQREAAIRQQQHQELTSDIGLFGSAVDSLVQRRQKMAQALASAQIYAQTPEGKQVLAPTQTPTPGYGAPLSAGTQGPAGPTTETPSPVNMQTLQRAFLGESPSNLLTQLFERQKQSEEFGLQKQKEALQEKTELGGLRLKQQMEPLLAAIKGREVGVQQQGNIQNQISSLQQKKAELIKDLPGTFGTFLGNTKAQQAKKAMADIDAQIASYQSQLPGANTAVHSSTQDLLDALSKMK